MSRELRYVNAYEVTRHYGGPEEGGWWFNCGEPLASVPLGPDQDPDPVKADLMEKLSDTNQGDIYSVNGGTMLNVTVEDDYAKPWPDEHPRYE